RKSDAHGVYRPSTGEHGALPIRNELSPIESIRLGPHRDREHRPGQNHCTGYTQNIAPTNSREKRKKRDELRRKPRSQKREPPEARRQRIPGKRERKQWKRDLPHHPVNDDQAERRE